MSLSLRVAAFVVVGPLSNFVRIESNFLAPFVKLADPALRVFSGVKNSEVRDCRVSGICYELNPWGRVFEKVKVTRLVEKLPAFYAAGNFTTRP